MQINVLSSHRFHLLDLARELSAQGHDVRFYSYVPARRCAEFGLNLHLCKSLLWLVWPFFALGKVAPKRFKESIVWYRNIVMDWYLAKTMRHCDICIGIGTVYLKAFDAAKKNGAKTILEWGSKHIIEQKLRFEGHPDLEDRFTQRELRQYEICDYISIPARHVKESFLKHGIAEKKLSVNPYGVDLSQFYVIPSEKEYDLIMVGGWRYEKGCDIITELCTKHNYRFLHVGALVNMEFPNLPNMMHVDPVDQNKLVEYYAKARVFILPSRSEGLALVQAQALACGLPVVCSRETGGFDLSAQIKDKSRIVEMAELTMSSLKESIEFALSKQNQGVKNSEGESLEELSWKAYGKRYSKFIESISFGNSSMA